jgi:hypothetical protein
MLQKLGFLPGFNKQVTSTGAESQWTGGENVRFRYGTPEKIGGWQQLGESKLTGVTRGLHHFVSKTSIKYAAIGTNRILYVYSGGVYYDIHPIKTDFGVLSGAFTCNFTNSSAAVTITFPGGAYTTDGISQGDILLMTDFTGGTGTGFSATDFDDKKFMITSVDSTTQVTITMPSASTASTTGTFKVQWYYPVGPAEQVGAYGWGISLFGGNILGAITTTLNGGLSDNAFGTGGSGTTITLTSVSGLPSTGTNYIQVGSEEISYTGVTGSTITGITRGVRGSTRTAHITGATVTNTSSYTGWGSPAANTDSVTDRFNC